MMSHLRRVLNLVTKNNLTGVYSLRRVNLLSRNNNLFYPTAKAADDAAAAKDPAVLFPPPEDDGLMIGEASLAKVERMQVPPPRLSFQPPPCDWWDSWGRLDCAALSETKTVFVDRQSGGAFLYDSAARCVVTMPTFPPDRENWPWGRLLFPVAVAGAKEDDAAAVCVIMDMESCGYTTVKEDGFKFRALVHRDHSWQLEELPRPPYFDHDATRNDKEIVSYAMAGSGGAADVICVSTVGRRTYCYDTASRVWSKKKDGDWALPFSGKVERDRELGIWLGFLPRKYFDDSSRLCATSDLFTDVEDSKLLHCARDLEPPSRGWHERWWLGPKVVSLGSGKFCVAQFFEIMRSECSRCGQEDADKRFAVFTGVEVIALSKASPIKGFMKFNAH